MNQEIWKPSCDLSLG